MRRPRHGGVSLVVCTILASFFLLPATGAVRQAKCGGMASSFLLPGSFYTLAGRFFEWRTDGQNTTWYGPDLIKWNVQNVTGDIALLSRTTQACNICPESGENVTEIARIDYEINTSRTILSMRWKGMQFNTTGFEFSWDELYSADVDEHTWAWFPTNLSIGTYVLIGWTGDGRFTDDTQYEVVGEEIIQVLNQKQDCWIVRMPPSNTTDQKRVITETFWVDKDVGLPLKMSQQGWDMDNSAGWGWESVLVHTNVDLGLESYGLPLPAYDLPIFGTSGFPAMGKFYMYYYLANGWHMWGSTNVTYYDEGLFMWWVTNVTSSNADVHKIQLVGRFESGQPPTQSFIIRNFNYTANTDSREILTAAGVEYEADLTHLTCQAENLTAPLSGDVGEETYCWLPTNLSIGSNVSISWTFDGPSSIDNATYTVIDEKIIPVLGKPQACWILHMPPKESADGTYGYSETMYSDKDAGIPLEIMGRDWTVGGTSSEDYVLLLTDTNIDIGPQTYNFSIFVDGQAFGITVSTNSTIPDRTFSFSRESLKAVFNVTGFGDTKGFCNVTIPKSLLQGEPWTLRIDNAAVVPSITSNGNNTFVYFNYNHSIRLIEIIGTWAVPEFPSFLIVPLFMSATVLAVVYYKRKRPRFDSKPA